MRILGQHQVLELLQEEVAHQTVTYSADQALQGQLHQVIAALQVAAEAQVFRAVGLLLVHLEVAEFLLVEAAAIAAHLRVVDHLERLAVLLQEVEALVLAADLVIVVAQAQLKVVHQEAEEVISNTHKKLTKHETWNKAYYDKPGRGLPISNLSGTDSTRIFWLL